MKTFLMPIVLTALLVFMSIADFLPDSPLRLGFVKNAEAIIGMPWTPFSLRAWRAVRCIEKPHGTPPRERCRCQRCCRECRLRERCCGAGCCRKCCRCAGCRCQRCCRPESCRSCRAHRHGGAVPALWMQLDRDQRRQLFQLRRRLLSGGFSGQQHRVYRVSSLRARSRLLRKTFRRFMLRLSSARTVNDCGC